jgi:hypothetical protein
MCIEHHGQEVSTFASYSGGPGLKSWPLFSVFIFIYVLNEFLCMSGEIYAICVINDFFEIFC